MTTATTADIKINHTGNGWHTATVPARSASTGLTHDHTVTWRTQPTECHGQMLTDWSDRLPVWVDESFGEVRGGSVQCGTCGSRHAAAFSVR